MIQLQKTEIQLNVVITVKRMNLLVILVKGRPVPGVGGSKDLMGTSTVKIPVSYFCLIIFFFLLHFKTNYLHEVITNIVIYLCSI